MLGTLVGTTLVAVGVGPRTVLDIAIHVGFLVELLAGPAVTLRAGPASRG